MGIIYTGTFDPTFEPKGNALNALFALMIGENEGDAEVHSNDNYYATAVDWNWLGHKVPGAARNYDLLIDKGFVEQVWWDSYEIYALNLTVEGDQWLSKHYGFPAWVEGEDDEPYRKKRSEWIQSNVTARWRKPRVRGESPRAKPTARTTSDLVTQVSYSPDEAVQAIAKIDKLYRVGALLERSAAGYKATITRRIVQSAVAPVTSAQDWNAAYDYKKFRLKTNNGGYTFYGIKMAEAEGEADGFRYYFSIYKRDTGRCVCYVESYYCLYKAFPTLQVWARTCIYKHDLINDLIHSIKGIDYEILVQTIVRSGYLDEYTARKMIEEEYGTYKDRKHIDQIDKEVIPDQNRFWEKFGLVSRDGKLSFKSGD
jgi:hypothetical protein